MNWGGGGLEFADLPYHDTTTNTDLTMNRVSSPNLGRWHSPDPVPGNPSNPQSWNMYAYVANNPTTSIDPLGLDPCTSANTGPGGSYACSPEHAAQSNLMDPLGVLSIWMGVMSNGLGGFTETVTDQTYDYVQYVNGDPEEHTGNMLVYAMSFLPGLWSSTGCGGSQPSYSSLLTASEKRVAQDLGKANCALDFNSPLAPTISALSNVQFGNLGPITGEGGYYGQVNGQGQITLNSQVDWASPQPVMLGSMSNEVMSTSLLTAGQYMDLAILHELEHYQGTIGNPDTQSVMVSLFWDCIK